MKPYLHPPGTDDDLFAHARRNDPETSKSAAKSISSDHLSALQNVVISALKRSASGLTVPEIAEAASIPRDTISPRIRPLVNQGLIIDTGTKRVPPNHTRSCIVWGLR